jgi:hypothetical protein
MDPFRLVWIVVAVALAVGIGAGLAAGKTVHVSRGSLPSIVHRRKEPLDFWMMIGLQAFAAAACIWVAVAR